MKLGQRRKEPLMAEVEPSASSSAAKTVSHVLGEIVWLMTQSPTHKQLFISDLEWFCMTPILLRQFRTFPGPQGPAAVALWASISAETEARIQEGPVRLRADEWQGGDRLWLIDLIAPFGGHEEILADLSVSVFDGRPFNFHAMDAEGGRAVRTYEARC